MESHSLRPLRAGVLAFEFQWLTAHTHRRTQHFRLTTHYTPRRMPRNTEHNKIKYEIEIVYTTKGFFVG